MGITPESAPAASSEAARPSLPNATNTSLQDSSTTEPQATPRPTISTLPPELRIKILSYLHHITSTSLALACKPYYAIHKECHPSISFHKSPSFYQAHTLYRRHIDPHEAVPPPDVGELHKLLKDWMKPRVFGLYNKFVSEERSEREMKDLAVLEEKHARAREANGGRK